VSNTLVAQVTGNLFLSLCYFYSSVLWYRWLGDRNGIWILYGKWVEYPMWNS